MKFTKTDCFFFFLALFLSGVGMLQPINPIFGYTLIIIGIVGMAGVLIRAVRRKQNNASYSSVDDSAIKSLLDNIYSLYNETGLFIKYCYTDDMKISGGKSTDLHKKFKNYLKAFKGKALDLPQELELKMLRFYDILFDYKQRGFFIVSAAKNLNGYNRQQKLEQDFSKEVPVLYSEIEVELRKLLSKKPT